MASSKSALKRVRTSMQANLRNRARKSKIRTMEKNFRAAVAAGDAAAAAQLHRECCSTVDKAAKVGTIHPNNAANKKSQFDKLINAIAK